jgi:pimeloyl-ACP methyl ester carboxylesterase
MKYLALPLLWLISGPVSGADTLFDSKGVKIRYVSEGKGEAVVLIHGWMGDSGMWGKDKSGNTKLNTENGDGFQLIALDCRGHGKSDKLYDPAQYGEEMAADVVRLLDHLKIDKAHLIGYSSGAFIAGKVAATHPDRVRSLVYAAQAPIIKRMKVDGEKVTGTSEVEIFAKLVDEGKDLGEYILAVSPAKPKPTPEQAKLYAHLLFNGKDVKAFAAAGRSFPKLAVTGDELKKCTAPVLFIHGANESDYVKESVAIARKALGRGEIKVIEGADHITTLVKPEFGTTLIAFLRSNMSK